VECLLELSGRDGTLRDQQFTDAAAFGAEHVGSCAAVFDLVSHPEMTRRLKRSVLHQMRPTARQRDAMTRLLGPLLLAVLLLAGCRLDGQVEVAVDGNGGGTLAVALLVDDELRRAAATAGADPLDALEQAGRQLKGWKVTRPDGAERDGSVTLSTRFRDPEELERITTQFAEGLAGAEVTPLGPMRVEVTDDTVALTGTADLRMSSAVRELGMGRRQARSRLANGLRFRVTARMPGAVLQTNADGRPDDTTVVWDIAPGERRPLRVSAARPWTLARIATLLLNPYTPAVTLVGITLIVAVRQERRDPLLRGVRP
jgi:hypothetical protein